MTLLMRDRENQKIGEKRGKIYETISMGRDYHIPEEEIIRKINDKFDLTPRGIINYLDLQKPIYKTTTNYGHFGKDGLTWEKIVSI